MFNLLNSRLWNTLTQKCSAYTNAHAIYLHTNINCQWSVIIVAVMIFFKMLKPLLKHRIFALHTLDCIRSWGRSRWSSRPSWKTCTESKRRSWGSCSDAKRRRWKGGGERKRRLQGESEGARNFYLFVFAACSRLYPTIHCLSLPLLNF